MDSQYARLQSFKRHRFAELERQLKEQEDRQLRLLDALESRIVEPGETTQRRFQQIKTAKEAMLIQIAEARTSEISPALEFLKASQVDAFGKALRKLLQGKIRNW